MEWTGLDFGKFQRAVENREKWRKLIVKSSAVPKRPSMMMIGVRTPPCVIACTNVSTHVKDPVVHVSLVDYGNTNIPSTQHSDKNNQLDDCGRSIGRRSSGSSKTL